MGKAEEERMETRVQVSGMKSERSSTEGEMSQIYTDIAHVSEGMDKKLESVERKLGAMKARLQRAFDVTAQAMSGAMTPLAGGTMIESSRRNHSEE